MRIGGVDPSTLPNEEFLVLPRGDKFIVFKAQGLPNTDEFKKLVPEPKPPVFHKNDGSKVENLEDPNYKSDLAEFNKRWLAYLVVASLRPSQIEWDTVKEDVPGTWAGYEKDLENSGINQMERNAVIGLVMRANNLDESHLKKARENFLRGPQPA